jgi:hypothetical protein
MSKSVFIPEISYENLVREVCGNSWRSLPDDERQAAWGVAIVKSVLDGVKADLQDISTHLGVEKTHLQDAFHKLNMNGAFSDNRIYEDDGLENNDITAWGYYAGYACGATGPVLFNK